MSCGLVASGTPGPRASKDVIRAQWLPQVCFFLLSSSLSSHRDTNLVTPVKSTPFWKNSSKSQDN